MILHLLMNKVHILIRGEQSSKGIYHLVCEIIVRHIDEACLCKEILQPEN